MPTTKVHINGLILSLASLCALSGPVAAAGGDDAAPSPWHYQVYLDVGYAYSNNDPANDEWRSKSTTNRLNDVELFLAMGNVRSNAS